MSSQQTRTVEFPWGWVEVSPLPGYVQLQFRRYAGFPSMPTEIVSGLGGTEAHPARPGSEAYRQYLAELEQAEARLEAIIIVATLALAVTRWERGGRIESSPPADWTEPEELTPFLPRAIIGECDELERLHRRANYLILNVLVDPDDLARVVREALDTVSPQEVAQARELFRGQTGRKGAKTQKTT